MIIIPSVSVGNVPQLAVDSSIHTYGFESVSSSDDEYLAPFVGPMDRARSAPQAEGIATAAQLFRSGDNYLVQLRSPPVTGHKSKFLQALYDQLKLLDLVVAELVVAGSANAGMSESSTKNEVSEILSYDKMNHASGSGFLKEAFETFPKMQALVIWVYEGDNFTDAEVLAKKLIQILQLAPHPFEQPISWQSVYGKKAPHGIEQGLYT